MCLAFEADNDLVWKVSKIQTVGNMDRFFTILCDDSSGDNDYDDMIIEVALGTHYADADFPVMALIGNSAMDLSEWQGNGNFIEKDYMPPPSPEWTPEHPGDQEP